MSCFSRNEGIIDSQSGTCEVIKCDVDLVVKASVCRGGS